MNYKKWFKKSSQEIAFITKDPILFLAVLLIFGSLIIFILYPLCKVITASVFSKGQFSFIVLKDVISNWYFRQGFYNSIIMGTLTSIIGAGIGFLFAFTLARTGVPFKEIKKGGRQIEKFKLEDITKGNIIDLPKEPDEIRKRGNIEGCLVKTKSIKSFALDKEDFQKEVTEVLKLFSKKTIL